MAQPTKRAIALARKAFKQSNVRGMTEWLSNIREEAGGNVALEKDAVKVAMQVYVDWVIEKHYQKGTKNGEIKL